MKCKLGEIAKIYYGPHRTAVMAGTIKYLVSSDFDDSFQPTFFKESYLEDDGTLDKDRYILEENDVIVTGKGKRLFAWAYNSKFGEVVPSSLFYIIKLQNSVVGEYIAHYLNSSRVNHKLKALGAGTSIPSIQKHELAQLEIVIPTLEKQHQIVEIARLMNKDVELAEQLVENKKTLRQGLLNDIINEQVIKEENR
ncbi:restriction endonuclease subunit S [Puteibacter caeruleilacunae]|nr:restriction endonuclease subunit S [Puteibacter caeruleilacunae]